MESDLSQEIVKKLCRICKEEKSIEEFRAAKTYHLGVKPYCKICDSKIEKERYYKNKEKIIKGVRFWQENNRRKVLQYKRNWLYRNEEGIRLQQQKLKNANKEQRMGADFRISAELIRFFLSF